MPKKVFRVVYAFNYIFQAGFSMAVPAGMFILLGWLLTNRWGVGKWAMAVCIVLGVFTGFFSVFRFISKTIHSIDPTTTSSESEEGKRDDKPK